MIVLKFLATSYKPIKIQYFKTEKQSTANMRILFRNSITFFSEIYYNFLQPEIKKKFFKEMRMKIMKMTKNISQFRNR